ncbi:GAF and ANTAR domain-containing protein [Sporichthya sp.]|uniref:GAF and ANTAR domain-containing protein n=1 Tax=Sporichthya sp. TaxID=65475 RepID=UPI0017BF8195|nr:GAF and ANTAR domain-containing protein [Sporichthya sp.]MBA3742205.1 GAF and ANTAR domain-containing protein [Sporichthya sp.]
MAEVELSRESDIVRSLVELADVLTNDYDVVDLLTRVSDRCVSLLGISAAGVMLADPNGDLRLIASSSEAMRIVELFELQAKEGPCLDAFRTGERVAHENLHAGTGRWPRFATVALEAGFQAAFALPLRIRDTTIGALNLFSDGQVPMAEADVLVARAFADLATMTVLQQRAGSETQRINEQLTQALTSRIIIEQAKGVIFERAGIDMAESFARLRAYSRHHNTRLTDVARATIDGSIDPHAWTAAPATDRPTPTGPDHRNSPPSS